MLHNKGIQEATGKPRQHVYDSSYSYSHFFSSSTRVRGVQPTASVVIVSLLAQIFLTQKRALSPHSHTYSTSSCWWQKKSCRYDTLR
eukprot:scaffold1793_cov173-Amphora_coffeaeformis.AAC.9